MRDSHRSPLLPHSSMGGRCHFMQQTTLQKKCLSTRALRMLGNKGMHTRWRGADEQTGWLFCHHVSRPFTCNRGRSHKGRWWRRHQDPEERETSIFTPHKICEEHARELRSINTPFYYFLLYNTGSGKLRLLMSRALWRVAGRLNKQTNRKNITYMQENFNTQRKRFHDASQPLVTEIFFSVTSKRNNCQYPGQELKCRN